MPQGMKVQLGAAVRERKIDDLEKRRRQLRRDMGEIMAHLEALKKSRAPGADIAAVKEIHDDQWLEYCSVSAQIRDLKREWRATAA